MNASVSALPSESERYLLITWCCLILLTSVPGNVFILIASIRYRAIKLDKITVILIQNIAFNDLCCTFGQTATKLVTAFTLSWPFGDIVCKATVYINALFTGATICMLVALNTSKLTCLIFPLRARTRSNRAGYKIAIGLWAFQGSLLFLIELASFLTTGEFLEASYSPLLMMCDFSDFTNPIVEDVFDFIVMLVTFIPTLVILSEAVWLLLFIKEVRRLQQRSIVTVFTISLVFAISYLPFGCSPTILKTMDRTPQNMIIYTDYLKVAFCVQYFSYSANPLIYYFSVKSFNCFVNDTIISRLVFRRTNSVNPRVALRLQSL